MTDEDRDKRKGYLASNKGKIYCLNMTSLKGMFWGG